MATPNSPNLRELLAIQHKLDTWELEHLREHAAALYLQVEALKDEIERWRNEAYAADARADMFLDLSNELQESTGARIGITRDGHVGALKIAPTAPVAMVSAYELAQFCTNASMAAGTYFPFDYPVSGLEIQLCAANDPFKRGVLVCLADTMNFIRSKTGAKTLDDLLLEPAGQDVERPGSGGRDD